ATTPVPNRTTENTKAHQSHRGGLGVGNDVVDGSRPRPPNCLKLKTDRRVRTASKPQVDELQVLRSHVCGSVKCGAVFGAVNQHTHAQVTRSRSLSYTRQEGNRIDLQERSICQRVDGFHHRSGGQCDLQYFPS